MRQGSLIALLLIATLTSGCAGVMTQIVHATTQAVNDAPNFQSSLTPAQYQTLNVDLDRAVHAEDDYVQLAAAAVAAKQQPPLAGFATMASALTLALTDLTTMFGGTSNAVIQDIKSALGFIGKL